MIDLHESRVEFIPCGQYRDPDSRLLGHVIGHHPAGCGIPVEKHIAIYCPLCERFFHPHCFAAHDDALIADKP